MRLTTGMHQEKEHKETHEHPIYGTLGPSSAEKEPKNAYELVFALVVVFVLLPRHKQAIVKGRRPRAGAQVLCDLPMKRTASKSKTEVMSEVRGPKSKSKWKGPHPGHPKSNSKSKQEATRPKSKSKSEVRGPKSKSKRQGPHPGHPTSNSKRTGDNHRENRDFHAKMCENHCFHSPFYHF